MTADPIEVAVSQAVHEALLKMVPELVESIRDVIRMGENRLDILEHMGAWHIPSSSWHTFVTEVDYLIAESHDESHRRIRIR